MAGEEVIGMPPHCETRGGPVVNACRKALDTRNVKYALIRVPPSSEPGLAATFERTMRVRRVGGDARDLADDRLLETVVRLHRASEGEPIGGMKPAGMDEGTVVPRVEKAIETCDPSELIGFMLAAVDEDLRSRFDQVMQTRKYDPEDVTTGRSFVQANLDLLSSLTTCTDP